MYSRLTRQLIESLQALPGIGPKSAQRIAFQLLKKDYRTKGSVLSAALGEAIEKVKQCARCQNYTEDNCCELCNHPKRDESLICIVESPADVVAIEQTSSYSGLYFVLHGHLSPLDGIGPAEIHLPKLFDRIQNETIHEVIIATNPTMEGRATAHYIANHVDSKKIQCSRIAHGVPLGGELEYLDGGTLAHAFRSRTRMEALET